MTACVFALICLVALAAAVVAFVENSRTIATIAEVVSRYAFAGAVVMLSLIFVPRSREVFIGFGVELPTLTLIVISCFSWNGWQTMLFLILMQLAVIADGLLYGFFHGDPATRRLTQWCSFLVSFAISAVLIVFGAALILPLGKLMIDLS